MSFADVAEECIQTRYPRKAWIGRLVTPLFRYHLQYLQWLPMPCVLLLVKAQR